MDKNIFNRIKAELRTSLPKGGQAILFGSQARGDARKESDWDVLVILDKNKLVPADYDTVTYPLTKLGWDMGVEINSVMYTQKEWEDCKITPFYHNVIKDGIVIS